MKALLRWIAAGLGTGYFPIAPGTVGSLLGIVIYLSAGGVDTPMATLIGVGVLVTIIGFVASREGELAWGHDPSRVVIDEVAGQYWTLVIAGTATWPGILLAFLLFRLFDIWKPWLIDRLQALPGAYGVMADDLLAGLVGGVLLRLFILVSPWAIF